MSRRKRDVHFIFAPVHVSGVKSKNCMFWGGFFFFFGKGGGDLWDSGFCSVLCTSPSFSQTSFLGKYTRITVGIVHRYT